MLSPKLQGKYVNLDSAIEYITAYRRLLEEQHKKTEGNLAVIQQAQYNYSLHVRERIKAERLNNQLYEWLAIAIIALLSCGCIIMTLLYFHKNNIIQLQKALMDLEVLKVNLGNRSSDLVDTQARDTEDSLRQKLQNKLMALYEKSQKSDVIDSAILVSDVYGNIKKHIDNNSVIGENNPIWPELESIVLKISPNFKTNLELLTSGRLTTADLRTALLVKCGFTPTQMAIVFGRTKGTIVSRRDTLSVKVLGEKKGTKIIDSIIRLL